MRETDDNEVERTSRQVIEHRLLTALEDDPTAVAIIASKEDLDLLIRGLCYVPLGKQGQQERCASLLAGLKQLRRETFGE